jgi:methionine synthase II (cobalamin-independent)
MSRHVHFVGTIGLDSVEEVFATAGKILGPHMLRCPDGETGGRRQWVMWQYPFLRSSPYLQADVTKLVPEPAVCLLKLAPGVKAEDIHFGELGYAREARVSYEDFLAARKSGQIPAKVRFQVCLPTPKAFMAFLTPEAAQAAEPAYERAMVKEVERICERIPHQDLAIQWDVCFEMLMWDGRFPLMPRFPGIEASFRQIFARLCAAVPRDVQLGVHLCYGDNDAKHFIDPLDLGKAVELGNLIIDSAGRPLDWIHMPVPANRSDDAYFAPLKDLHRSGGRPEVFLGLVHLADGVEGTRRRIAAASRVLPDFGIATECGMARARTREQVLELLRVHAGAAA